jgi:hypothetical protein
MCVERSFKKRHVEMSKGYEKEVLRTTRRKNSKMKNIE